MTKWFRSFIWALAVLLSAVPLSAQTLRIYHIDVEQASATLFVATGGRTLLVDSGKNGQGRRIKAVMDRAGVSVIDFFVDTHYHEDHLGGIDALVALGVPVMEAHDHRSGPVDGREVSPLVASLLERKTRNQERTRMISACRC